MIKYIGLGGYSKVGKDTFFTLSSKYLKDTYGLSCLRLAFADSLKDDLLDLVRDSFGWDIKNLNPENKEILRPLMVAYGVAARQASRGHFWTNRLSNYILDWGEGNNQLEDIYNLLFITDVRYENEVEWVRNRIKGGKVINITKINANPISYIGHIGIRKKEPTVGPGNDEEAQNGPRVEAAADCKLIWPDAEGDIDKLMFDVKGFWERNKQIFGIGTK